MLTPEVLDRFARHVGTGEPMPEALLEKLEASRTFNQGYITVEYLAAAIVDMDLHTLPDGRCDPDAFERQDLERIGMPRQVAMRHRLPHFTHLFTSEGYAAGYYSYLWSETMDADAWRAFEEAGDVWSPEVAAKLRDDDGGRRLGRPGRALPRLPRPRPGGLGAAAAARVPGARAGGRRVAFARRRGHAAWRSAAR